MGLNITATQTGYLYYTMAYGCVISGTPMHIDAYPGFGGRFNYSGAPSSSSAGPALYIEEWLALTLGAQDAKALSQDPASLMGAKKNYPEYSMAIEALQVPIS